jgi:hypothetical protein
MYLSLINSILDSLNDLELSQLGGRPVYGFMLLENGTLNHLSKESFRNEVIKAAQMVLEEGSDMGEALADSYGV